MKTLKTRNLIFVTILLMLIFVAAFLGVFDLLIKQFKQSSPPRIINKIEISADKKSILNAETKGVIFTIADTQRYLKDSGYFYNPDTFQTTNAKYEGDCFIDAALSNKKDKIVFSTGCLPGDLPRSWIGVHNPHIVRLNPDLYDNTIGEKMFLISGSGRNFVWSADDKTIIYDADLGLSGMTEIRTTDSQTGEILERKNTPVTNNKTEINEGVYLKDDKIYSYDKVRGFLADDKINIYIGDKTLSFTGDIKELSFIPVEGMDRNFYYGALEISDGFTGPYQIYKKIDMNKISYRCDGSLLVTDEGKQLPNYYCKTDNKDFKSQYEFSAANGNGFATGGDYTESWYKLYIKKINGVNYTFNSRLKGSFTDSDDKYSNVKKYNEKYNEDYKNLSSKKYLDEILANEENIKLIKEWDEFVENIKFIEKGETVNWKTYKNEEYGFEFRYPASLNIREKTEPVGFKSFSVFLDSENFNGYLLFNSPGVGTGFSTEISTENITIGNIDTKLEILDSPVDNQRALIVKFNKERDEYFWLFRFDKKDNTKASLAKNIFSTFKFIEPQK